LKFQPSSSTGFVKTHKLLQYLYRDDIDKAVYNKFDPEDEDLFKEFLEEFVSFSDREQTCVARG
jgi:hypothetical protein